MPGKVRPPVCADPIVPAQRPHADVAGHRVVEASIFASGSARSNGSAHWSSSRAGPRTLVVLHLRGSELPGCVLPTWFPNTVPRPVFRSDRHKGRCMHQRQVAVGRCLPSNCRVPALQRRPRTRREKLPRTGEGGGGIRGQARSQPTAKAARPPLRKRPQLPWLHLAEGNLEERR